MSAESFESKKLIANAVTEDTLAATAITADVLPAGQVQAEKLQAGAPEPAKLPDHDQIRAILQAENAPPRITLDIGGSKDVNSDGLVTVSLGADGHELVFEDA